MQELRAHSALFHPAAALPLSESVCVIEKKKITIRVTIKIASKLILLQTHQWGLALRCQLNCCLLQHFDIQ